MSVVAKILIVLNLLLAVVFLGSAATFLGAQETWKKKHNDLKTETDASIAGLTADKASLQQKLRSTESDLSTAQTSLADIESKWEAAQDNHAEVIKRRDQLAVEMTKLTAIKDDLVKQIAALTKRKDELVDEKETALGEKRTAIEAENVAVTEQRRLHDNLNDANDMIGELEKQIVARDGQIESLDMQLRVYKEKYGELIGFAAPPLKGRVSAVNGELNIVVLSIGRDDKVEAGYEFTIYRGSEYVGKVVIDKVDKDFCSGYSRKEVEKAPIEVGDNATTRF